MVDMIKDKMEPPTSFQPITLHLHYFYYTRQRYLNMIKQTYFFKKVRIKHKTTSANTQHG